MQRRLLTNYQSLKDTTATMMTLIILITIILIFWKTFISCIQKKYIYNNPPCVSSAMVSKIYHTCKSVNLYNGNPGQFMMNLKLIHPWVIAWLQMIDRDNGRFINFIFGISIFSPLIEPKNYKNSKFTSGINKDSHQLSKMIHSW